MEIIRQGKDPKTIVYEDTCSNCKQVVHFKAGDPEIRVKTSFDQRDQGAPEYHYTCSCCGKENIAYGKEVGAR